MPDYVLVEEYHLTFAVPQRMSDADRETARRILDGRSFVTAVRQAMRDLIRSKPALAGVRLIVST